MAEKKQNTYHYKIEEHGLQNIQEMKDLGVICDCYLKLKSHKINEMN